ncbi:unnamed protein product [Rotaria magnacalcarata]|uniref:Conotoxin n=1 Tax=Rotaria magnacalcarata TaxID=392030 RepID=A0A816ZII9_9BILA|nr:unnamed protein product [Rotaria magnacalcarata]CAF3884137.1 unnamed protein product [Rotaria magnacalcarata]
MQISTLLVFGLLATILFALSIDGKRMFVDSNDEAAMTELKARMMTADDESDDNSHQRRASTNGCVNCALKVFDCCAPNICVKRFLMPNKCMKIKA